MGKRSAKFRFLETKHDGGDWRITSPFGQRKNPISGRSGEFHSGIDIGTYSHTRVYAPIHGWVAAIKWSDSGGNMLIIRGDKEERMRLLHLLKLPTHLQVGDRIEQGDFICQTGNTGYSTGAHLHLDIQLNGAYIDPIDYLQTIGLLRGYGSVDK